MSLELLKKQIKTGEFKNFYVIYGDEDYLKEYYCKKIIKKAVAGLETFNLQRFDGVPDMSQLAAAVNNLPLMSERKCVVVKDADPQSIRAGAWKELQGIIKSLPPECILIFYFDAVKPNAKKDAKFKWLLAEAAKRGLAVEIKAPPQSDIVKFVSKRAAANGCEIDSGTAKYLVESCGEGLNTVANELDKVCAYCGGGKITRKHIDAVVVHPMTSSIYDLARAVVAGRLDKAMGILDELFYKKEEPVIILSVLSGAFCDLYRAKAALMSGVSESQVLSDFNYRGRGFAVRNAMRDCRSAGIKYLARCLDLLLRADAQIKGSSTDKRVVLERLIIEIGLAEKGKLGG